MPDPDATPTPEPTPVPGPGPVGIAFDDWESDGLDGGFGWAAPWWAAGPVEIADGQDPLSGLFHIQLQDDDSYLSRKVDLSGWQNVTLQFWAKSAGFEGSDFAKALVSPDGVHWTIVKTWTAADADGLYQFIGIGLAAFEMTEQFHVAFDMQGNHPNDQLFIDDVLLVGQPAWERRRTLP